MIELWNINFKIIELWHAEHNDLQTFNFTLVFNFDEFEYSYVKNVSIGTP